MSTITPQPEKQPGIEPPAFVLALKLYSYNLTHNKGYSSSDFYNNTLFSDVKIKFGGHSFPGHRSILSMKSLYFYKAFSGTFLEAQTKVIDLGHDDDPNCIFDMLRYIYGCSVNTLQPRQSDDEQGKRAVEDSLLYNVKLFATADKYDISSLRASIGFRIACDLHYLVLEGDFVPVAALTSMFNYEGDNQLKNLAMNFCYVNLVRLTTFSPFLEMLKEHHDVSVTLLARAMQEVRDGRNIWACGMCNHIQDGRGECPNESCDYGGGALTVKTLRWSGHYD